MTPDDEPPGEASPARTIAFLGRKVRMPRSRRMRVGIGVGLMVGGILGFLPVLGFWMLPLGIIVLSYEYASVRRMRRRTSVWWGNRRGRRAVRQQRASVRAARDTEPQ